MRQRILPRSRGFIFCHCEPGDGDTASIAQRLQSIDFLQPFDEPGARPMRAVVALIEFRFQRVLSFEHSRRVRYASEELRLGIRFPGAETRIECRAWRAV